MFLRDRKQCKCVHALPFCDFVWKTKQKGPDLLVVQDVHRKPRAGVGRKKCSERNLKVVLDPADIRSCMY